MTISTLDAKGAIGRGTCGASYANPYPAYLLSPRADLLTTAFWRGILFTLNRTLSAIMELLIPVHALT